MSTINQNQFLINKTDELILHIQALDDLYRNNPGSEDVRLACQLELKDVKNTLASYAQIAKNVDATALPAILNKLQKATEKVKALHNVLNAPPFDDCSLKVWDIYLQIKDKSDKLKFGAPITLEQQRAYYDALQNLEDRLSTLRRSNLSSIEHPVKPVIDFHIDYCLKAIKTTLLELIQKEIAAPSKKEDSKAASLFHFASSNQNHSSFAFMYEQNGVNIDYRKSACTAIAGQFVLNSLQGLGPDKLDKCMVSGHEMMIKFQKQNNSVEHTAFDELMPVCYKQLDSIPLTQELLDLNPFGQIRFDRQLGLEGFKAALNTLISLKNANNLDRMGVVITNPPESYGLMIYADNSFSFFDSHGIIIPNEQPGPAYATYFSDVEIAAQFLSERMPVLVMDDAPVYNEGPLSIEELMARASIEEGIPLEQRALRSVQFYPVYLKAPVQAPKIVLPPAKVNVNNNNPPKKN